MHHRLFFSIALAALLFFFQDKLLSQANAPRTLVAVLPHADDEGPAAPMIARYAREGVQVHLLIASDGGQGTGFADGRGDAVARDQQLVKSLPSGKPSKMGGFAPSGATVPQRGEPPLLVPDARYVTVRVPFAPEDLQAGARSMACHKSQFTDEVIQRVLASAGRVWNGAIPLIPAFETPPMTDLFR